MAEALTSKEAGNGGRDVVQKVGCMMQHSEARLRQALVALLMLLMAGIGAFGYACKRREDPEPDCHLCSRSTR